MPEACNDTLDWGQRLMNYGCSLFYTMKLLQTILQGYTEASSLQAPFDTNLSRTFVHAVALMQVSHSPYYQRVTNLTLSRKDIIDSFGTLIMNIWRWNLTTRLSLESIGRIIPWHQP
jgi:hypothetical protein